MKKKAIDAFMKSMIKSGKNQVLSANVLALDTALTDAVVAAVSDLPEPDLFKTGDIVEIITEVPEVPLVRVGMQGKVMSYHRAQYDPTQTDTQVAIAGDFGRQTWWFHGSKELRKVGA